MYSSTFGPAGADLARPKFPILKTRLCATFIKKGFEIISVSLDDKKEKWTAALRQYQMPWIHISDVKGFGKAIVNEFVSCTFDTQNHYCSTRQAKIIATDLRGESLDRLN
jgi:hypothetical protein